MWVPEDVWPKHKLESKHTPARTRATVSWASTHGYTTLTKQTCWIQLTPDPDWLGSIGQNKAQWFLHTHTLDAFGPNLIRPSRSDPGRFCTIWFGPFLEEQDQIGWRKSDPAYMILPNSGCMLPSQSGSGDQIWIRSSMFAGDVSKNKHVWDHQLRTLSAVSSSYENASAFPQKLYFINNRMTTALRLTTQTTQRCWLCAVNSSAFSVKTCHIICQSRNPDKSYLTSLWQVIQYHLMIIMCRYVDRYGVNDWWVNRWARTTLTDKTNALSDNYGR